MCGKERQAWQMTFGGEFVKRRGKIIIIIRGDLRWCVKRRPCPSPFPGSTIEASIGGDIDCQESRMEYSNECLS